MKTTHRLYIVSLFLLIGLAVFAQEHIVVLHTNDTHSRIEPLPETDRTAPGRGGVVRRAAYIDQVRAANKQVLLFDAGDFLQGTPYFNLFKGKVEVEAMNLMKYDAVTLGNHEFDYGMEVLEKVVGMARFPLVASNYDFSGTALSGKIKPCLVLRKGKVRIGVIGINIQPKGLIAADNYRGMKYLDPVETANTLAEKLRREHQCDMVICLSHLGYEADLKLAESSRNIDLIIGGHSHTYMEVPVERSNRDNKPVMIYQTNGRGVYVGRIDVTLEKGSSRLTFTDGMAMKGVTNQPEASVRALPAGNAHRFTPINTTTVHRRIRTPHTEWLQRKIYDNAVTLLKNHNERLPLRGLDSTRIASVTLGAPSSNAFQQYLKKYGDVDAFQAKTAEDLSQIASLKAHDLLIISLHSDKMADVASLQQLTKEMPVILVFFTLPSAMERFKPALETADAVIMAYDTTAFAQMSAAQGIFGGIGLGGKLPVTTASFPEGSGLITQKTRLSYSMPEEVGIPTERLAGIEPIALEGVRQRAYPGCQILVAKDGVIIYEKEFGHFNYSHSPEVTAATVYDLASVTKASATLPAVMKLYDEKKIALQDPIDKFVPETKGSDKARITVRSLLLHESGITSFIPYYTTAIDPGSYQGRLFGPRSGTYHVRYAGAWARTDYRFLPDLISREPSERFYLPVAEDLYASDKMHDALLRDVIASPLQKSGRYTYSCLNFMLLKEAVEQITKTDLDTYVKQQFYRKLGASTTTFQPLKYLSADQIPPTEEDPFFRRQHLRGYVHDEGAALFGGISGNAGLFSTANDLAKLYQMWLNGGIYGGERYLSEETVKLFTTTKSSVSRRGLGFDKPDPRNSNASPTAPGAPITVYGHTGFTGTCFWIDPSNEMIYIFLSNRVNPSRSPNRLSTLKIRERIQEELYNALDTIK